MADQQKEISLYPPALKERGAYPLACLLWPVIITVTIFRGGLSFLGSFIVPGQSFAWFCLRWWARSMLIISNTKVTVEGLERIPHEQACVFIANHTGFFDVMALSWKLPVRINWVAKASLFRIPFLGWHMRRNGYVCVERNKEKKAKKGNQSINQAITALQHGASLVVFPEGTRSRDGRLRNFKTGAFVIAKKVNAPLVPITIEGAWSIIRPDSMTIHRGKNIKIYIHEPISSASPELEKLRDLTFEKIKQKLITMRGSTCQPVDTGKANSPS